MVLLLASFTLLVILSMSYSVIAGGRSAQIACLMMLIATVATRIVSIDQDARLPLLLVDTALLAGIMWVSLFTRRYWPLWAAGLQASGVAANIAVMLSSPINFATYYAVIGFWSLPILIVMPVGIYIDQRAARNAERSERRLDSDQ